MRGTSNAFPGYDFQTKKMTGLYKCYNEGGYDVEAIIAYFLDNYVETEGKFTQCNVILQKDGMHFFTGFVYPDKNYGVGIFLGLTLGPYFWQRYQNIDTVHMLEYAS